MRTRIALCSIAFFKAFVSIFVLRSYVVGLPLLMLLFTSLPISEEKRANQYGGDLLKATIVLAPTKNLLSTFNRLNAQQYQC